MDRLVNFVLVGSALAALVFGAVVLGTRLRDDSVNKLTESVPAAAAAVTADSQLRSAVFAANSYFVQHSTYADMTADKLRAEVDGSLASEVAIEDGTATDFCVETTIGEKTFSYRVHKGFLTPGSGC